MNRVPTIFLMCLLALLSACDRPFQDVGAADVEVVSPDVNVATDSDRITLELRVTSVRDVVRVESGGIPFSPAGADGIWRADFNLSPGLNRFLVESTVDDGPVSIDTVDVLRVSWSVDSWTADRPLLFTTGGHTMNRLSDGTLVLIGGSTLPGSGGTFDAWSLAEGSTRFAPARDQTVAPRVGHTATLLPDDRILLLGGGQFGNVESVSDLVETAEIFDPSTGASTAIPVDGPPIRRMYHTAILREVGGSLFVVVLGGRGDTRYGATPTLGIRQDMRTFELRNDSLFALSPAIGPFIRHVAGHTQTALAMDGSAQTGQYLVTGLDFEEAEAKGISLLMDFNSPAGIDLQQWPAMQIPRIRHASVTIEPGIVAHFGGRRVEEDILPASGEIHVTGAGKSFLFPPGLQAALTPAYGLTATRTRDGRIALVGGFDAEGTSLAVVDFVSLGLD